jgi:hypothetical protein
MKVSGHRQFPTDLSQRNQPSVSFGKGLRFNLDTIVKRAVTASNGNRNPVLQLVASHLGQNTELRGSVCQKKVIFKMYKVCGLLVLNSDVQNWTRLQEKKTHFFPHFSAFVRNV